jgi:hypothetical protein
MVNRVARHVKKSTRSVYVEKAVVTGTPFRDRPDLALGAALISPQANAAGADIYHLMREVEPGDVILHLVNNSEIKGFSFASAKAQPYDMGFESWYRVPLRDYTELRPPLGRDAIFSQDLQAQLIDVIQKRTGPLFFNKKMAFMQGAYLTRVDPGLLAVLDQAYQTATGKSLSKIIRR